MLETSTVDFTFKSHFDNFNHLFKRINKTSVETILPAETNFCRRHKRLYVLQTSKHYHRRRR